MAITFGSAEAIAIRARDTQLERQEREAAAAEREETLAALPLLRWRISYSYICDDVVIVEARDYEEAEQKAQDEIAISHHGDWELESIVQLRDGR